jgi:hypothetical protein
MLKGGADLELQKDQEVVLVAVGAAYETYEGGKDEATGEELAWLFTHSGAPFWHCCGLQHV